MDLLTIVLIAIGLGIDCFAVSMTRGMLAKKDRLKAAAEIAFFFGVFQAGMCVAGWVSGEAVIGFISGLDHWLAFVLLSIVGLKMLHESRKDEEERNCVLDLRTLLALSIATSIDSLAVGLSFAFLDTPIILAATIIGIASAIMSAAGFCIGNRSAKDLGKKSEFLGGIILMAIGLRILLEHLMSG